MTRDQFIYALTACGCLLKDGKTWYEHDELTKCFEDLGLLEPKSEWEQDHAILKAYSDGANEVLDEIRAEIEAKCCITVGRENEGAITVHDVFEILDKYKAETENP